MKIISNQEYQCYETCEESWNKGKQITLDGKVLIPIDTQSTTATNGVMKLIIDISEETYQQIINMYDTFPAEMKKYGVTAIKNGKPINDEL